MYKNRNVLICWVRSTILCICLLGTNYLCDPIQSQANDSIGKLLDVLQICRPCFYYLRAFFSAWQFLSQIFDNFLYKHKSANITFVGGVLLFSVKWRYVTLDFTDNPIWKLFTTHKIVHSRENLRSILSASKILCRLVFLLNRIKLSRKRLLHFSNRFKLKL